MSTNLTNQTDHKRLLLDFGTLNRGLQKIGIYTYIYVIYVCVGVICFIVYLLACQLTERNCYVML